MILVNVCLGKPFQCGTYKFSTHPSEVWVIQAEEGRGSSYLGTSGFSPYLSHSFSSKEVCHILNTNGFVTTFDVVRVLKEEHSKNNISMVMMDETSHQLYHSEPGFYLHPKMCCGDWKKFITKYKDGITQEIAFKLIQYLNKSLKVDDTDDCGLLELRDNIKDWSENYVAY